MSKTSLPLHKFQFPVSKTRHYLLWRPLYHLWLFHFQSTIPTHSHIYTMYYSVPVPPYLESTTTLQVACILLSHSTPSSTSELTRTSCTSMTYSHSHFPHWQLLRYVKNVLVSLQNVFAMLTLFFTQRYFYKCQLRFHSTITPVQSLTRIRWPLPQE